MDLADRLIAIAEAVKVAEEECTTADEYAQLARTLETFWKITFTTSIKLEVAEDMLIGGTDAGTDTQAERTDPDR